MRCDETSSSAGTLTRLVLAVLSTGLQRKPRQPQIRRLTTEARRNAYAITNFRAINRNWDKAHRSVIWSPPGQRGAGASQLSHCRRVRLLRALKLTGTHLSLPCALSN